MLAYIEKQDEKLCCGCGACAQICGRLAIVMKANEEGFFYPVLDETRCVDCGICDRVCPMEKRPHGEGILEAYAVRHRDGDVLKSSSSGGVFRLLADGVIQRGGCVVGCVWGDGNHPVLRIAETYDEIVPMQGSKYLSSSTGDVFQQIKAILDEGRMVLVTGAPCQCAGLLNFLQKPYENLITADFLCHGMPSQTVFDAYIAHLEKRLKTEIYNIRFRDKRGYGCGEGFSYDYMKNGKTHHRSTRGQVDPYVYGYLHGYFNRYSCYACPFTGEARFTDITFCDFWGVERVVPELNDGLGVSVLSVNSEKGTAFVRSLGDAFWKKTISPETAAKENPGLLFARDEKIPDLRERMYSLIRQEGWRSAAGKYLRVRHRFLRRIWYAIPRDAAKRIKRGLRHFVRTGE